MSQDFGIAVSGPSAPLDMYPAIMNSLNALKSGHLGAGRPSYAELGTFWAKQVNSTTVEIYFFDGTSDILVSIYNPTAHSLSSLAVPNNGVTLAKLEQIASGRLLGRTTAGSGNVEVLTPAQVAALLPAFMGDSGAGGVQGLVPAPGAGDAAAGYILYADGSWGAPGSGVAPGITAWTAADSAPTGWILSYGQEISRSVYAQLFAAIGEIHGAGNGSTTFRVPDLRDRVIAGKGNMGGVAANRLTNQSGGVEGDTLGAVGGAETHALTGGENGPHSHTTPIMTDGSSGSGALSPGKNITPANTGSSGLGTPHNNVQPTIILNGIIKI